MQTEERRLLKKKLLHVGRSKLVKQLKHCEGSNVLNSPINGSKNDLISRIINSIASQKQNKKNKNKKKKKVNRKPLKIDDPIYNDANNDNKHEKKRKLNPSSCNVTPKKKRKRKLKPKSKPKPRPRTKTKQRDKNPQKYIYKIINMNERPFLNGKHCKIISILKDKNYRIRLLNNESEQIIPKHNLERIRSKHRRHKAIHIIKSNIETNIEISNNNNKYIYDFSDVTIKESMSLIKSFKIDINYSNYYEPLAIGVFVKYQMILQLFINNDIKCLFGTKYKTFKTHCLLFLDDYDQNIYNKKYKIIDDLFIILYYKCNDKQIIFLMRNNNHNNNDIFNEIEAIKAMNLSLMYACNVYKNMPSDLDMIEQVFKLSDKYGFGELNKKEFNNFLSTLSGKINIKSSSSSTLFDNIDKDKIKAITFNQFVKYMIGNKKVLWQLLLELATDYELNANVLLMLYQNTLSKIHKLLIIMDEIYEIYKENNHTLLQFYINNMIRYIQFINTNQTIIDDKVIDYEKCNNGSKCKNIKYIENISYFIHNNMPDIDMLHIDIIISN